jgi:hypothetical protein
MATGAYSSKYTKTYTTFSGADIVATFNKHVVGELESITYNVTREKAPVYVMGSSDPKSFSRGKRGIGGSMVFTVFNRDNFWELKQDTISEFWTAAANKYVANGDDTDVFLPTWVDQEKDWAAAMQDVYGTNGGIDKLFVQEHAIYADQIPPFDVTISLKNEYGQAAKFVVFGCEILNEGSGMSMDDITTEKACTYVARGLSHMTPIK